MIPGILEYPDALRPAWMPPDREARVFVRRVAPSPAGCAPLVSLRVPEGAIPLVVEDASGVPVLLFDPRDCFALMTCEEYCAAPPPGPSLPVDYHVVPARLRNALVAGYGRLAGWMGRGRRVFPRWPADESLALLLALLEELGFGELCPPRPRWPDGARAAFCPTHDVDSREGQSDIGRISDLEDALGVRSAWFFTTGAFPLDHGRLLALHQAGHEIGSHDSSHDMRTPHLPPARIRERLQASLDALAPYAPRGYRSPGLVRTPALYEVARTLFEYDSSSTDTESFPGVVPPAGSLAVWPFLRAGMPTLPITVPQDVMYLWRGFTPDRILASMRDKIRWIKAVGGMAMLLSHPERSRGGSEAFLDLHRQLLEEAKADPELWLATPAQVVASMRC